MNNDNWSKETEEEIEEFLQRLLATQKELQDLKVYVYRTLVKMSGDRRMDYEVWEVAEEERVLKDYDLGIPLEDIAARFRRTPSAIKLRLSRRGKWVGSVKHGYSGS